MEVKTERRSPPPWLVDESDPANYQFLQMNELLDLWNRHRNDLVSCMAANEICRRIARGDIRVEEAQK